MSRGFLAGTFGVTALAFFGPPLADFGLKFGPPEFCTLIFMCLILIGYLGTKSFLRGLMMVVAGMLIGAVGQDPITMQSRFVFCIPEFNDGIGIVPVMIGIFGIGEILCNVANKVEQEVIATEIKNLFPSLQDWQDSIGSACRGSVIDFFIGLIPGGGAIIPMRGAKSHNRAVHTSGSRCACEWPTRRSPGRGAATLARRISFICLCQV